MGWIQDIGKKISEAGEDIAEYVFDALEGLSEYLALEIEDAGEQIQRWRDNVRNLDPASVSEELWGQGGRFAYIGAAAIMAKRSPSGVPMRESYKEALRPYFGEIVDSVILHWGISPLNEWAADLFKIKISDEYTFAQAFGYDIYIRQYENEWGPYRTSGRE